MLVFLLRGIRVSGTLLPAFCNFYSRLVLTFLCLPSQRSDVSPPLLLNHSPSPPPKQDITMLHIFNGGLVPQDVAGNFSREALFGANNMRLLEQHRQQQRAVPVAG